MKADANRIRAQLDRPPADLRLFLFHGPDEAGALDFAERLARAMGPDAERVDIDPGTLKSSPGRLAEEAASLSLFGTRRYIRVVGAGEDCVAACSDLLAADRAGNPAVVIAPGVKTTGKLVKLAIASQAASAFACYVPNAQEAAKLAAGQARELGMRLAPGVAERLAAATLGDRMVMARELEKLAMYLDAAPDRPRDADEAAYAAIGADLTEGVTGPTVAALIDGDPARVGTELARLDASGALTIPLLRALVRRLITLAEMRAEVDGGASTGDVVDRHRIHFSEKAATSRALRRWNAAQIAHAVDRARAVERATTDSNTAGPVLAEALLVGMARAASRLG